MICDSDSLSLEAFEVYPNPGLPHSHWKDAALTMLEHLQTEKFTLRLGPVLELADKAYAVTLHVDKLRQKFSALPLEQMRS